VDGFSNPLKAKRTMYTVPIFNVWITYCTRVLHSLSLLLNGLIVVAFIFLSLAVVAYVEFAG
jgi:hypothetical protein